MRYILSILTAFAIMIGTVVASAPSYAANKKIVLQISDGSGQKQTLVLNVANNLLKYYGPSNVDLEIVAFGPGLRLLFADNVNSGRVDFLVQTGVRFSACQNTTKKMSKILGYPPELTKVSIPVKAGVARILELTDAGYTLIRP